MATADKWYWDERREEAAYAVAAGEMTGAAIARKAGVNRATLWEWKTQRPEFVARVAEHRERIRAEVTSRGVADVVTRIQRLQDRFDQIELIRLNRRSKNNPTGLEARSIKSVGFGEDQQLVEVFTFDAAMVREEREIAKQAAQELGQWLEKTDVTSNGQTVAQQPQAFDLSKLTMEEREAMLALLEKMNQ